MCIRDRPEPSLVMKKLISFCCEFTAVKVAAAVNTATEVYSKVFFIDLLPNFLFDLLLDRFYSLIIFSDQEVKALLKICNGVT